MLILYNDVAEDSAKFLAESLRCESSHIKDNFNINQDVIIKYGVSNPLKTRKTTKIFNRSKATKIAIDKLKTFESLVDYEFIPTFFTEPEKALEEIVKGTTMVSRRNIKGNNGKGLVYVPDAEGNILLYKDAKLFTKYIEHTTEIRVCCWRDKVLSVYEKMDKNGIFNFKLWKEVEDHPQLVDMIKKVYEKIPLDFYGLDVVRDEQGKLWMLEINSAPILFPYTCKKLVDNIRKNV